MSSYRNKMMTSKTDDDLVNHLLDVIAQTKWNNLKVAIRAAECVTQKLKEDDEKKDR